MKKTISLLLALVMCLSLCACGDNASLETQPVLDSGTAVTEPVETTAPAPVFVTETAHCILDGIYVDNSFVDEDNPSLKIVYVLYTAFTNDQNLKISSKLSKLNFETGNSYSSESFSKAYDAYMLSYYSSNYIEDIFIGGSLKVMSIFMVPEAEFAASKVISVIPYGLPDGEELKVAVTDVRFFDSPDALAEAADPEGFAQAQQLHEPADDATVTKVKQAINGYYWSFYVNNTSYEIEFYAPDMFEVRVRSLGVTNGGTYEILNGYIVCTYDSNGAVVEIPWAWGTNDIEIDPATAFSVSE